MFAIFQLEMPPLACFSLNLGQKPPDPDEVSKHVQWGFELPVTCNLYSISLKKMLHKVTLYYHQNAKKQNFSFLKCIILVFVKYYLMFVFSSSILNYIL